MSEIRVKNAFGVKGLELAATGELANPSAPLSQAGDHLEFSVQAGVATDSISIFDGAAKLNAKAGASLQLKVHQADSHIEDPFGDETPAGPQARWGEFAIHGALEAGVSGNATSGPWRFSASAMASTELDYRRLLPLPNSESVRSAATLLLQGARTPGRFFDNQLQPGEWHRFAGRLRFGFEAGVNAGFSYQYQDVVKLFDGFSPEIKATASATVAASLGLSLFESTEIVVRRAFDAPADQLRLRIARVRDRGLTFGVKVALGLQTNLGTVLNRTLDHVFSLEPVADVLGAWKEVAKFADAGTWKDLEKKLSKKAADTVLRLFRHYVDLENSATINEFVGEVAGFLKKFDAIEGRIQDLWADLLEHAGVGAGSPLPELLAKIGELGQLASRENIVAEITKLKADEEGRLFLRLLELLSGETVEGLLALPEVDALQQAIAKVGKAAREAKDLIANGPVPKVIAALRGFAEESGIAGIVKFLRENATSGAGLQAAVERPIRKVVSRLFHKAWEELEESELVQLRAWAEKVAAELADFQKWEAKLRADLKRLDEKFGFSLSFELSRQFHQEAFFDGDLRDRIWEKGDFRQDFQNGDLPAFLHRLAETATDDETDDAIVIRECSFLSRRIRSSSWTLVVEALGLKFLHQTGGVRTVQSLERIREDGRRIEISGKGERIANHEREGWRSSAELQLEQSLAKGAAFGPDTASITFKVSIEDDKALAVERVAIDRLLADVGLGSLDATTAAAAVPENANFRFGLEVGFQGDLRTLIGAISNLGNRVTARNKLLAAVRRLFGDELVSVAESRLGFVRTGNVLNAVLDLPGAEKALDGGSAPMETFVRDSSPVQVDGRSVSLLHAGVGRQLIDPVRFLPGLSGALTATWPGKGRKTGEALTRALGSGGDLAAWEKLASAFAAQHNSLRLDGYATNPMLGFWVLYTELSQLSVASHAAASIQSKRGADDEWSVPLLWQR